MDSPDNEESMQPLPGANGASMHPEEVDKNAQENGEKRGVPAATDDGAGIGTGEGDNEMQQQEEENDEEHDDDDDDDDDDLGTLG